MSSLRLLAVGRKKNRKWNLGCTGPSTSRSSLERFVELVLGSECSSSSLLLVVCVAIFSRLEFMIALSCHVFPIRIAFAQVVVDTRSYS